MNYVNNFIVPKLVLYSLDMSVSYWISKSVKIGNLKSAGIVSLVIA